MHLQKEFVRCCPTAKDFFVQWEDMAPLIIDWARTKFNSTAEKILEELNENITIGKNVKGIHIIIY